MTIKLTCKIGTKLWRTLTIQKTNKIMKKIFLVGKVHEVEPATIMTAQQEIQNDLDRLTGEHKVEFTAKIVSESEMEFTFSRTSLQNLAKPEMINIADAWIITGEGLDGFRMAEPLISIPYGSCFNSFIEQTEFIDCYKKSARALGASRMKDIKLEITPEYAKLKLSY